MSSLVLILATFMRRIHRVRSMSPEMRKMRRNVVMQELVLHVERRRVLAKELENLGGP